MIESIVQHSRHHIQRLDDMECQWGFFSGFFFLAFFLNCFFYENWFLFCNKTTKQQRKDIANHTESCRHSSKATMLFDTSVSDMSPHHACKYHFLHILIIQYYLTESHEMCNQKKNICKAHMVYVIFPLYRIL